MKVIINADDLGISNEVNESIELLMDMNAISSASILANGDAFNAVKNIVGRHPAISFGVHLNLSEFKPLTKSEVLFRYGITNSEGSFVKGALRNALFTNELKHAIYIEWYAQIKKIQESGIKVTHLDGHHHCHTQPELYGILKLVAHELGIKRIRQNGVLPMFSMRKTERIAVVEKSESQQSPVIQTNRSYVQRIKNALRTRIWHFRAKLDFITTDLFLPYEYFEKKKDEIRMNNNLTIELMCHPGHANYRNETDLIIRDIQRKRNVYTLVSYLKL